MFGHIELALLALALVAVTFGVLRLLNRTANPALPLVAVLMLLPSGVMLESIGERIERDEYGTALFLVACVVALVWLFFVTYMDYIERVQASPRALQLKREQIERREEELKQLRVQVAEMGAAAPASQGELAES